MSGFTIDELAIPRALDGAEGDDFRATVEVRNAVEADALGSGEFAYTADELIPGWHNEYEPRRLLVARVAGRIVARAIVETRTEGSANAAWLIIQVLPEYRGRGIGTALAQRLEAIATAAGRTHLHAYAPARATPGERLASPTGFGSVPAGDPGVRFLSAHGWSLEQVERCSRLALPLDRAHLSARLEAAREVSGPDYRIHVWGDRTPARWLDDLARLITRMSTDAPAAGMDAGEEVWTAERVAQTEERNAASPLRQVMVAIEHVPSGHLVGYTELWVPPETGRAIGQGNTIVLREHRGHRLGMLLKLEGLARVHELHPGHPSVVTFNAEENTPMIAVNEAVGFTAIAYEGAWKKVLPGADVPGHAVDREA